MPIIQSAKKRMKVTATKNLRNRMVKSAVKTEVRKFNAVAADKDAAAQQYVSAVSAVDKAASKGVISKNSANRKKARMAKAMAKA